MGHILSVDLDGNTKMFIKYNVSGYNTLYTGGIVMYEKCIAYLKERGVTLADIAECVMFLQKDYHPELTKEECILILQDVLHKREVQYALLTGMCLDQAAEKHLLMDATLEQVLMEDSPLYGIDEVLAYGICNLYGSIALTNYGYIDRIKPGIIATLNDPKEGVCHTFLDDIVGAIAASAAGKIAHNAQNS